MSSVTKPGKTKPADRDIYSGKEFGGGGQTRCEPKSTRDEKNKEDLSRETNIDHILPPFIFSCLIPLVILGHAGPAGCKLSFK